MRPLFVCVALLLFANVVYGGSYQRTRDGETLVWRDVPERGDEATWSGKRDKDGYATGSGVLTWYKAAPAIVTGSNIADTRRYVVLINHYSGTMVRGKFKGAVTNLEAEGKRLHANSGNERRRPTRPKKATRTRAARVKPVAAAEPTSTPVSEPIVVETPERTSTLVTPTPASEQSPVSMAEESQTAVPPATKSLANKETVTPPEQASEQSPPPNAEQGAVSSETDTSATKETATATESAPEQVPSTGAEKGQTAVPEQTGTVLAKAMATPPPEQQDRKSDTQSVSVSKPAQPNDSAPSFSAPFELPKPSRSIDEETVTRLDTLYQSAVKANDVAIMDEILADDFVLVTDRGESLTKADLIKEAKAKRTIYEHQEVEKATQKVRIWRDTAVVTALLRVQGTTDQNPFDYKVWVSETYVRTPTGWRYVFGQRLKPEAN